MRKDLCEFLECLAEDEEGSGGQRGRAQKEEDEHEIEVKDSIQMTSALNMTVGRPATRTSLCLSNLSSKCVDTGARWH